MEELVQIECFATVYRKFSSVYYVCTQLVLRNLSEVTKYFSFNFKKSILAAVLRLWNKLIRTNALQRPTYSQITREMWINVCCL